MDFVFLGIMDKKFYHRKMEKKINKTKHSYKQEKEKTTSLNLSLKKDKIPYFCS